MLNAVTDSAEEDESKEMLLVYHLLLHENQTLTVVEITVKTSARIDTNFHVQAKVNINRAVKQPTILPAPLGAGSDVQSIIQMQ